MSLADLFFSVTHVNIPSQLPHSDPALPPEKGHLQEICPLRLFISQISCALRHFVLYVLAADNFSHNLTILYGHSPILPYYPCPT